jgi:hypothetical protein
VSSTDLGGRLQVGRNQRAPACELGQEEIDTLRLVPVGVRAEAKRRRHGRERFGVPGCILTDVEARQGHAERADASEHILHPASGDELMPGGLE